MEKKFIIENMSCAHCLAKIEKGLRSVKGVKIDIDLNQKVLTATSKKDFDSSKIVESVEKTGYTAKEI